MQPAERLKLMVVAALVDGRMGPDESSILMERAASWGVPVTSLIEMVRNPRPRVPAEFDPGESASIYWDLVAVTACDGVIGAVERRFLRRMATRLGLTSES